MTKSGLRLETARGNGGAGAIVATTGWIKPNGSSHCWTIGATEEQPTVSGIVAEDPFALLLGPFPSNSRIAFSRQRSR